MGGGMRWLPVDRRLECHKLMNILSTNPKAEYSELIDTIMNNRMNTPVNISNQKLLTPLIRNITK